MKHLNKFTFIPLVVIFVSLLICIPGCHKQDEESPVEHEFLPSWDKECEAFKTIIAYVDDVTNPDSPDFIPERDRIMVSDMDGTICGERNPIYTCWLFYADYVYANRDKVSDEAIAIADEITKAAETGVIPSSLEGQDLIGMTEVFAGMPVEDFRQLYRDYLMQPSETYENRLIGEEFFFPMLELYEYLEEKGFTIYICSGTDRDLVRVSLEKWFCIPYDHIIGTDTLLAMNDEGKIVRTDKAIIKNVKENKASQIAQEIGQKPVLSFGNSTGDICMSQLVTLDNKYKSLACMVLNDDEVRDNGNYEKAMELKEKWDSYGWTSISMKDNFKMVYGPDVKKK